MCMVQKVICLAISTGNIQRQAQIFRMLGVIKFVLGEYSVAQSYAYGAQRLARMCGNLYKESQAILTEAFCRMQFGHYKESICLCVRARDLLGLCGMSGSVADHTTMHVQAEIHKLQSGYIEAHHIYSDASDYLSQQGCLFSRASIVECCRNPVVDGNPKQQHVDEH